MKQCALSTGMDYKTTAVNWASYIREMFMEYVYKNYQTLKFDTEVEIDESLFGRKIKYNRGRPTGQKIWIFGIVERSSNLLVLYPVDNRDAATLIPIIQKHVRPGTRIYSDNWAAYFNLNNLGYEHFTVTHKTTFKQIYKHVDTGEIVQCNTNRIEGAWKISKDHFRKINGTNTKLFEQHLCEVIWRNHIHRANIYESFFDLMKSVYTLGADAIYEHTKPLFGTWTPPSAADEQGHNYTIIQNPDENSSSDEEAITSPTSSDHEQGLSQDTSNPVTLVVSSDSSPLSMPNATSTPDGVAKRTLPTFHESHYETDTDSGQRNSHPYRFVTLRKKSKGKKKQTPLKRPNIYEKKGFQYEFSTSDSDFV